MRKVKLALLFVLAFSNLVSAATTHTVKRGDTLWDMAKNYYGDPTLYTIIAEVNGVTNPRTILDGTVLVIPNKSDMQAIQKETDSSKRQALIQQAGGKTSGSDDDNNSKQNNNNNNNNNNTAKYVAPKPEDTTFESVLNKEVNSKTIKTVNPETY
jgi:LysM repeat protein